MQMIITDAWLAKSGTLYLSGRRLLLLLVLSAFVVMLLAVGLYHWVFLKGAREGWPVIGSLVGVLVSGPALTLPDLQATLDDLESLTHQRTDLFTVIESRLFERKMQSLLIHTQKPVTQGEVGSAFGWRLDPLTARTALHTGLDFRAESGNPILAAAGGVGVTQEFHPEYGNMIEIEHGDDLISRYAHASKTLVKKGDLIKRGQKIAEVGSTGRSTGAHLHFEVMVQGVFQDPQKFLLARQPIKAAQLAQATSGSNLSRARTR